MSIIFFTYVCVAIFAVAGVMRIRRQLRLPMHLRWELYPVKHEAGARARYGGSYMEESGWWEKKRHRSLFNEMKYMIPEILLLRGVWQENRRLWWVSFPFHFGLYLLIFTLGLFIAGAMMTLSGGKMVAEEGVFSSLIYYLTILTGFLGLTMGTVGTAGLLSGRISDPSLKNYSSFADFFNLIFFLVFFVISLLTWLFTDHDFSGARSYLYSLLTFGGIPEGYRGSRGLLGQATVFLASLLIAYVPLTHMAHMFMKYFLYHAVRWEDTPNLRGSGIEAEVLKNLGFKPTWAASHIGADGKKTWAEVATSVPPREGK